MTQHWKLKTNTVNNLLVLVILILVKAGWTDSENTNLEPRKLSKTPETWTTNNLENQKIKSAISFTNDTSTSSKNHTYLNRWDRTQEFPIVDEEYVKNLTINSEEFPDAEDEFKDPQLYENDLNSFYGESVADTLFHSSTNNISLIFTDLSKCLYDFNFITCLKMLLLNRVNNMLFIMEKNNLTKTDLYLLDGYVAFKLKNETEEDLAKVEPQPDLESKEDNEISEDGDDERYLSLDQELSEKVLQLFKNRSLQITLLPGFGLDIKPLPKKKGEEFVCFSTRTFIEPNFNRTAIFSQMRKAVSKDGGGGGGGGNKNKKKKKDKGGFSMMPMMMIPQMIMLGFMPFALANLKMMVMNAFMMNTMALNSAIFMTIRNLIFGPRGGPKIKYVNYGYKNKIKSKKPEIILHSPAAFVKQPEIHKKPPKHVTIISNSYSHNLPSSGPHHESAEDFSGPYPPSSQYSSEADDSYDYDHSGPHAGLDEGLSNNKYSDDSFGEFSNNHKNVANNNKYKTIIIRKKNANRRKTGPKPERIRIKKRPGKLPTEVKSIVDKFVKSNEKKNIPLYRDKNHYSEEIINKNRFRTTTLAPISEEEESEENTSQDLTQPIQPTNLYHPITSYYYPNKSPYDSYNYPQNYKTTERSNTWSVPVPAYAQPIQPSSNPISYNNYYGNSPSTPALKNNFQEPEYPDYNFDILKVMPNMRNQIYSQKPVTEKNNYSDYLSKLYDNQKINKNQIDRISTNGENNNNFRNDHQISTDYRTVFSSKYNKDHVNFDKHSDNRHKNHNYSRL